MDKTFENIKYHLNQVLVLEPDNENISKEVFLTESELAALEKKFSKMEKQICSLRKQLEEHKAK